MQRHVKKLLLVLGAVALVAAVTAVAGDTMGLKILPKDRGTRLTSAPRLVFVTGELRTGRHGSWQLADGTQLQVDSKMDWRDEDTGAVTYPQSGRQVLVTGQRLGNVIQVRQVTLLSRQRQIQAMQTRAETTPDEPEEILPR